MNTCRIVNARLVNEGRISEGDLLIENGRIARVGGTIDHPAPPLDAQGRYLLPGLIDDQVHFREPGLTHKADLQSESRAAAAGGITSYFEMPNTSPATTTRDLWQAKMDRAAAVSAVNYAFFLGATPDNLAELIALDGTRSPGVKIFMGSSTGDLLVEDPQALEAIFREVPHLIATHCEHEPSIRANLAAARDRFGEQVPMAEHPHIRSAEACLLSTQTALDLARRHGSRLHVLHLSTAAEVRLFDAGADVRAKRITCEACVHHLWFTEADYAQRGAFIKWNPAIKSEADRAALRQALLEDRIDVLATDHAPHTRAEKGQSYFQCPSGAPMVQHALSVLYTGCRQGWLDLPTLVRKYAHAPAELFRIVDRGYLREGCWADLVLFDAEASFSVTPENLFYKCGWSPLEGDQLWGRVLTTWVNGEVVFTDGQPTGRHAAQALRFAPQS